MKSKLILLLCMILFFGAHVYSQTDFLRQVNTQLNQYILGNIQEKIYVQTNSNQYSPGDTIWFKISLMNAINHKPLGAEYLYYVDLISPDNKLISHQMFSLENGFSDGALTLDSELSSGQYKLLAYTNYMQNFSNDFLFQKPIELIHKTELQTDWEFSSRVIPFANGDSVFIKMYAHSRNGRELNEDVNVMLQLARGSMLGAACPITNNEGSFSFFVPDSLKLPVALLSVKPDGKAVMSEKYRIKLSVQKPDLQFLPEGGELVAGQENLLAFRCVGTDGNPIDIAGELIDEDAQLIARFTSEYQGAGGLKIVPEAGQEYVAKINYRDSVFKYDIPEVRADGYSLQLTGQNQDSITFTVLKSGNENVNYYLVGHCRGSIKFMGQGILKNSRLKLSVPTQDFPEGILTFTLFINRIPRAERLVYHDSGGAIQFKLTKELVNTKRSSPINFTLLASQNDGSPVQGNFSVLAWNTNIERSLDSLENIRNYLLLSSDLRGEVFTNTDLFNSSDPKHDRKLDLMLLTYGWRRFNWVDVASYMGETKPYEVEKGIYLDGKIYRKLTGKPVPKNFEVSIILQNSKMMHVDKAYTNDKGEFGFYLPEFADSASLTIQTKNRWAQQKDYLIDLNTNLEQLHLNSIGFDKITKGKSSPLVLNLPASKKVVQTKVKNQPSAVAAKPATIRKPRIDNYYFPGKDTFMIEEVEARSKFLNRRDSMISQSGQPDVVIESAQLKKLTEEKAWYSSLWDLLADQIPGLKIRQQPYQRGLAKNSNLVIADPSDIENIGGDTFAIGAPAVYFNIPENPDGYLYIFVDDDFLNNGNVPLYDFLSYMNPGEIESINFIAKPKNYDISMSFMDVFTDVSIELGRQDLVDGLEGSSNLFPNQMELMEQMQRTSAPPSFLFITTKSKGGIFYKRTKGLQTLYINGLTPEREFYVPKYQTKNNSDFAVLSRKTIYWQPQLVTDSLGRAHFSINSKPELESFAIQVQGINADGISGSGTFTYENQNDLKEAVAAPLTAEKKKNVAPTGVNRYQNLRLYSGIVTDRDSGSPISFADLSQPKPYYHESTNSEGEFFLSADRLNESRQIVVSSPGYQMKTLVVPASIDSTWHIELVKSAVVQKAQAEKPLSIVRKAIRESRNWYASGKSFQGYNRETVSIDQDVYGIYEMALNYSCGKYPGAESAIRFETVKFKNMEDKTGHRLMMLKPNHRSTFYPLKADIVATSPDFWTLESSDKFDYEQIGLVPNGGELCYKIKFQQKDHLVLALQSGILYIGSESGAVRYAAWSTTPDKRKYLSYVNYLQSNPMEYDVKVVDDYNEVSYGLVDGELRLQGTNQWVEILVNQENVLRFDSRLSVVGDSQRNYKDIKSKNADMLIKDQKSKHMIVKDAEYQIEPWVNLGIVKPEQKLIHDAAFLHDITVND